MKVSTALLVQRPSLMLHNGKGNDHPKDARRLVANTCALWGREGLMHPSELVCVLRAEQVIHDVVVDLVI